MYVHFHDMQHLFTPKPYLERQSDINSKMRAILVDWLLEVQYKFKLQDAALWLCINILDRFLEHVPTARSDLQLVGIASLLIACKFEEIYPPKIRHWVNITDYAYTKDQVLKMEAKILLQLDYQICVPTGYHFMIRYLNLVNASDQIRHLSLYYAERNLQEYDMLNCPPSQFSAAAIFAALAYRVDGSPVIASSIWSLQLVEITGYSEAEVIPIALNILKHVHEESFTASKRQLLAAKRKYSSEKYLSVSSFDLPVISFTESV
jgi:cyclin B